VCDNCKQSFCCSVKARIPSSHQCFNIVNINISHRNAQFSITANQTSYLTQGVDNGIVGFIVPLDTLWVILETIL